MKRILITGLNSYIGSSLENWLKQFPDEYQVDKICLRNEQWRKVDFSVYESIVHTVGIAHIKETKKNKDLYYKINSDLTYEVAQKAKQDKVGQFLFLSSMSVYGLESGVITENVMPNPKNAYGKSKLDAEKRILTLADMKFTVAIVRPPMVYGPNCPGNYTRLAKIAKTSPIFPKVDNKRSMIYIDNLSECLRTIIDKKLSGIFCPQNEEYINTSELVYLIAKCNNKNIKLVKFGNTFLKNSKITLVNKIFGDLFYQIDGKIQFKTLNFYKTIEKSESGTYHEK